MLSFLPEDTKLVNISWALPVVHKSCPNLLNTQEGRRVPWFSGCSVLNPALQPGGRYQGWSDLGPVPIPTGRGGGLTVVLLRSAILPLP